MFKKERKTIKGLKTFVVISFILLAAFITLFVFYAAFVGKAGDADLKDFGAVMKYHTDLLFVLIADYNVSKKIL